MEIKTSELSGARLDWAVAMAICPESFKSDKLDSNGLYPWCTGWLGNGSPSTNWCQGGPLIEWNLVTIEWAAVGRGDWHAYIREDEEHPGFYGPAPLVAAMRAIVAYKLGDTVTVPDELEG